MSTTKQKRVGEVEVNAPARAAVWIACATAMMSVATFYVTRSASEVLWIAIPGAIWVAINLLGARFRRE